MNEILALVTLFVAVPLNVIVTVMLFRQSRRFPHLRVLRERCVAAAAVLLTTIIFGAIFVNNDQAVPWLNEDATKAITRISMLVVGVVPAAYWLRLWRKKKKDAPHNVQPPGPSGLN